MPDKQRPEIEEEEILGEGATRPRRSERLKQILLELRLRPHVRIAELSERFTVSTETIRRDLEALSDEGLVSRDHGGASQAPHQHYPGVDERNRARIEERERIGRRASLLVQDGDTVMIDAGSTTLQFARFLAYRGTACTVLTNSLNVALALGQSSAVSLVMCPGEFMPSEAAVVGPDAIAFIERHNVRHCFIGASSVGERGVSETVRGFAEVKRAMLAHSRYTHLLVDSSKFRDPDMSRVAALNEIRSVVTDRAPQPRIAEALTHAGIGVLVAGNQVDRTLNQTREETE